MGMYPETGHAAKDDVDYLRVSKQLKYFWMSPKNKLASWSAQLPRKAWTRQEQFGPMRMMKFLKYFRIFPRMSWTFCALRGR